MIYAGFDEAELATGAFDSMGQNPVFLVPR